ncbi:MAG: inositol monophosphatase family protein [Dehalococcoidia bacterium]
MPPTAAELGAIAQGLAREAGQLIRGRLDDVIAISTKSTATDMVTEVDQQSERLIVSRLQALRPDDGLLGEEGTSRRGTSGVRWIFDPLDGTTNYIYGYPAFGVSIAAEVDGVVAAGAIYDALRGEMFSAVAGGGAFLGERPIRVTAQSSLETALVSTGFGYDPARRAFQGRVLAEVVPRVRDVRRGGSAALDLCWVACGRVDAYYEFGLNDWDMAAGALIVREAGGRTGTFAGAPPGVNTIVAAGPGVFGALHALVEGTHLRFPEMRA